MYCDGFSVGLCVLLVSLVFGFFCTIASMNTTGHLRSRLFLFLFWFLWWCLFLEYFWIFWFGLMIFVNVCFGDV